MQFRNWYIGTFGLLVLLIGLGMIVDSCNMQQRETDRREMIEACGEMCGGQVQSFELDWRQLPVCTCR